MVYQTYMPQYSRVDYVEHEPSLGSLVPSVVGGTINLSSLGISAGVSAATSLIGQWITSMRLRGGQKIEATNIANEIERRLKDNQAAYNASPKTPADYLAAKNMYDQLFSLLAQGCGTQQLGSAGQRCVEERNCEEGAGCKYPWKTWYAIPEPAGLTFDKLTGDFYDKQTGAPVTSAAQIQADHNAGANTSGAAALSLSSIPTPLLLFGGAALVLLVMGND